MVLRDERRARSFALGKSWDVSNLEGGREVCGRVEKLGGWPIEGLKSSRKRTEMESRRFTRWIGS